MSIHTRFSEGLDQPTRPRAGGNPSRWHGATAAFLLLCCCTSPSRGDDVVFADDFDSGLSREWTLSGIGQDDYRLRNGGLELNVRPGKLTDKTPRLQVTFPHQPAEVFVASVEVTVLDPFTEPSEMAGLYLTTDGKPEFGARKQLIDGHLVFAPGKPEFIGPPGDEGDPEKYALRFWPATKNAGPLRIVVRYDAADFQTGPDAKGRYQTHFHSALVKNPRQRGVALVAAGGPAQETHWVRFDNFRILRMK